MLRRFSALMVFCLAFRAFTAADEPTMGRWTALPVGQSADGSAFTMAVDPRSTVWITTGSRLRRWDGMEFKETPWPEEVNPDNFGQVHAMVVGNPQYGAYALHGNGQRLLVFRLLGTEVAPITELEIAGRIEAYAGTGGALWIVSEKCLAVFANGQWDVLEGDLKRTNFRLPALLDNGKRQAIFDHDILYTLNEDGKIVKTPLPVPVPGENYRDSQIAAFLGEDRLLTYDSHETLFCVCTLDEPRLIPGHDLVAKAAGVRFRSRLRSMPDGSVWAVAFFDEIRRMGICRIGPDYSVGLIPGSEGMKVAASGVRGNTLFAADGALWVDAPSDSIARLSEGQITNYDWEDGYYGGAARLMQEDAEGRIYVATRESVMVFDPEKPAGPLPAWTADWQEFSVRPENYTPDHLGGLWARFAGEANSVSHWDGKAWREMPLPEGYPKPYFRADSRGHLVLELQLPKGARSTCAIAVDGNVMQYPTEESFLEAAAKAGAGYGERYRMSGNFVITGDGRVINSGRRKYFDGKEWIDISTLCRTAGVNHAFASERYGVLLRCSDIFYAPKDDWFEQVADLKDASVRWMIGPGGVQPYEEELMDRWPERYLALKKRGTGDGFTLSLSRPAPSAGQPQDDALLIYGHSAKLAASPRGGHWIYRAGIPEFRILGRYWIRFNFNFTNTPLAGSRKRGLLAEDTEGNLWWETGEKVFMRSPPKIDFAPDAPLTAAEGFVEAAFNITCPTLDPKGIRLFARFKGGEWEYRPGPSIRLAVPAEGPADEIEVVAMDPLGTVTEPVVLKVAARTAP